MDNYQSSNCPTCNYPDKTIKMDENGNFYVVCGNCGFETSHFRFVAQAQSNWIENR